MSTEDKLNEFGDIMLDGRCPLADLKGELRRHRDRQTRLQIRVWNDRRGNENLGYLMEQGFRVCSIERVSFESYLVLGHPKGGWRLQGRNPVSVRIALAWWEQFEGEWRILVRRTKKCYDAPLITGLELQEDLQAAVDRMCIFAVAERVDLVGVESMVFNHLECGRTVLQIVLRVRLGERSTSWPENLVEDRESWAVNVPKDGAVRYHWLTQAELRERSDKWGSILSPFNPVMDRGDAEWGSLFTTPAAAYPHTPLYQSGIWGPSHVQDACQ